MTIEQLLETLEDLFISKIHFLTKDKELLSSVLPRWLETTGVKGDNNEENLQFVKEVYVGKYVADFMSFCLKDTELQEEVFHTECLEYRQGACLIRYSVHGCMDKHIQCARRDASLGFPWFDLKKRVGCEMAVTDASQYTNNLVTIHAFVNCGEKSVGVNFLKSFCDLFIGTSILLEAGFIFCGQYSNYYATGDDSLLDKLENYYTKQGFQNVNDFIGCYEEKIAMLHVNGSDFWENVKKIRMDLNNKKSKITVTNTESSENASQVSEQIPEEILQKLNLF